MILLDNDCIPDVTSAIDNDSKEVKVMLGKDDSSVPVSKIDDEWVESDDKFIVGDGTMLSDDSMTVLTSVNVDIEEAEDVLLIIAAVDDGHMLLVSLHTTRNRM